MKTIALDNGSKIVMLPPGYVVADRGALQAAINMLKRDSEEGFAVRGELAEELARSVTGN